MFCVLLAGFLWLERLRPDQLGVAAACVVAAAVSGALVAPRLDGTRPWLDYEAFAEKLEPNKAEAFSWNHSYGPLNWPRDGREMLRIKAKAPAYWKATNLERFDGVRWRRGRRRRATDRRAAPNRSWLQTIRVVDRGLRSTAVRRGGRRCRTSCPAPRAWPCPGRRHLRDREQAAAPGDTYRRVVYVAAPERAPAAPRSGNDYPGFAQDYLELRRPADPGLAGDRGPAAGRSLGHDVPLRFAAYGTPGRGRSSCGPAGFGVQRDGDAGHGQLALRASSTR